MADYVEAVTNRVVVYDGAMGTSLQEAELTADDFGSDDLEGCNELLSVTRPDVVQAVHASFLEVGVDVIETNSFGGFSVPLSEYGLEGRVHELNVAAARLAKGVAIEFSTADQPRWVAGSIGPGTKFATLGQITYRELRDAYEEQAAGLLEGGVDLFIIETQFDLLGLKAAINGARRAMSGINRRVPIQAQVTMESTGRMLPGTEIGAALAAIDPMRPDVFGINCATGPAEMTEHLRYLAAYSRMPIAVIPNAGLPEVARRRRLLRPLPDRTGQPSHPVHHRTRGNRRWWVLRHHSPASPHRLRGRPGSDPRPKASGTPGRGRLHLQLRAVPPGHLVPDCGRAHQRQRIQTVPFGTAGRGLGHGGTDGP